jgi:large subunit ribosomal protein L10
MSDLRRRLRAVNVEYLVAKNTLTRFAAERVNKSAITPDLEGPTAIAFGFDDPAAAARVMQDYLRTSRILKVKSAVIGDRRISPQQVQDLAELPSRSQLQARLLGALNGPASGFVGLLNGVLSQFTYILDQRSGQLGGAETAAAGPAE